MARKTVYIPDELMALLEQSGTDIAQSLSREFQDYLRGRIGNLQPARWKTSSDSGAAIRMLTPQDVDRVLTLWDDSDDGWRLDEMSQRRIRDNLNRCRSR